LASGNGVRNVLAGSIFAAAQEGGAVVSKTRRKIITISAFLLLSGCGEQELSSCLASTEQVILLRQMAMTPKQKEMLDFCISNMGSADNAAQHT
jgi:hypothetical protein